MPRTPLTLISSNVRRRKELSPHQRGIIEGLTLGGSSAAEISMTQNDPIQTVHTTLRRAQVREIGKTLPRQDRPKKASDADTRHILRIVRKNPAITYHQLRIDSGLDFSTSTFYRLLKSSGISNWVAKKRPKLTEGNAAKRLAWALEHQGWTKEQWASVIWSDECSVERGIGQARQWMFCTPAQKWQRNMIQEYKKGKDIKVMVWAAFSGKGGRSDIYVMDCDFEAKKMGYSGRSYIEVLDEMIPTIWYPELLFMQNNAPIHKAGAVKKWFADNAVDNG